jgi:hypothetical protein
MLVKIYLFANKKKYLAVLVADNNQKSIKKIKAKSKNSIMFNMLTAAIKAIESLKFPVDLQVISPRNSFKQLPEITKNIPDQDYVKENFELWEHLERLISRHNSQKASKQTDSYNLRVEYQKIYNSTFKLNENENHKNMNKLF